MKHSRLWIGRVLSALAVIFLVFDATFKLVKHPAVLASTAQLGFPQSSIVLIGTLLLGCTVIYVIPRTSILGAVLLTGYLGGAVATQLRVGNPLFETVFPVIVASVAWAGIGLRDSRLRAVISRPV
jgi:DoxX-like family